MPVKWILAASAGAALTVGLASGSALAGTNDLLNAGFDIAGAASPVVYNGATSSSNPWPWSPAADWGVWNNSDASTTAALVSSTDPQGGGSMLGIYTTGPENGVFQFTGGYDVARVSVDVFLTDGTFELGLGQGGYYMATATTSVLNQWVHLSVDYVLGSQPGAPQPNSYGNEIFLYSTNNAGAVYYVDNAYAGSAPEPATWAMMLAGFAGLGLAGRRAARKSASAAA